MTSLLLAIALGGFSFLGAATQRITGMGFSVVAAPFMVLTLGASTAIPLALCLSCTVCVIVLLSTYRDAEWKKAVGFIIPGIVGIIPGLWVIKNLPGPMMAILIGSMVLLAILAMLADERARVFTGKKGLWGAGFLSGFMNVTASVGGPAMILYQLSTGWDHRKFVATVQIYFIFLGAAGIWGHGLPNLAASTWLIALGSLCFGLIVGNYLAKVISAQLVGRFTAVIAITGSVATIIQGSIQLAG